MFNLKEKPNQSTIINLLLFNDHTIYLFFLLSFIFRYSPLHNIPLGSEVYPKMLLCTGDHDDRVAPLHTLKFVAELQHSLNLKGTPLLARIEVNAGHGASKPINKQVTFYSNEKLINVMT